MFKPQTSTATSALDLVAGVFPGAQALDDPAIARVVVTDSVPAFRLDADAPLRGKLQVVSSVALLADAIRESHLAWRR